MKIAHIADVHLRALQRHDEYHEVFTTFISNCKETNVDHIFVGGDIGHTKTTGISPEYIDFMRWWLNAMSEVAVVHLTLGNHDLNLSNMSRQDAVSPIVETLNNSRVILYKNSGMYEFTEGYVWCVFSLADQENWDKVKPVPGKVNIACYHGPVWGAKTESDWLIEDGLTVDFFKDYDLCFLGDIHKLQYLDYREYEIEIDEQDLSKYPNVEIVS
jgi:hypothetical protein